MQHVPWKGFEPLDQARWRALAEAGLRGKSWSEVQRDRHDGLDVPVRVDPTDPLAQPQGLPARAIAPMDEGQPWQIQQTLHEPEAVMTALQHGVEGLRISEHAQRAHGLHHLLDGVYLDMVDVHLDGPKATGLLRGLVERHVDATTFTGSCSLDVLCGGPSMELVRHVEAWGAAFPKLLTWGCDAAPWLDAGVSLEHALAAVVSGWDRGVEVLESEGVGFDLAAAHCTVRWAVGSEVLVEAAMLRALRMLWRKWLRHRHAEERPLWIDARTSVRGFAQAKPEDNLLRTVASTYAAVLGGADGLETLPHDLRTGSSSTAAQRYARNVQHLLKQESAMDKTFDPLQGSYLVEFVTNAAVERAWQQYRMDAEIGGWQTLWETGMWRQRVEEGRTAGLQAPLFLPSDVARGKSPVSSDWKAPIHYPDHEI